MVNTANAFLEERKTPEFRVRKNDLRKIAQYTPHRLGAQIMHEWHTAQRGELKGAGIVDAFKSVFSEAKHLLGVDKLMEWVGLGPKHIPVSAKEGDVAAAVQQTYKKVGDRRKKVGTLTRLPGYDTDRISVWKQESGQLLVSVHGTKVSWHDVRDDMMIFGGAEIRDNELETLLDQLDREGKHYDLAGHSLGTEYIQSAIMADHGQNADDILLFNPASSALQNTHDLQERANDKRYTYFINQGDIVSQGLYQHMNSETMNNRVRLKYSYDPYHAHLMDQWVPRYEDEEEEATEESDEKEPPEKPSWNVEWGKPGDDEREKDTSSGWTVHWNEDREGEQ